MADAINLEPRHGGAGRHPTREFLDSLGGHEDPGKFGRMFPRLPALEVSDEKLKALSDAMMDDGGQTGDNEDIPAGFTYLGQFIDHDITLDLTSLGEKGRDPQAIANFRTPSLDLDSIYGRGPDGSPHMYARDRATNKTTPRLLLGKNITVDFGNVTGDFRNDLPRSPEGQALIGDHRNDENLIVAQTHVAFLKFHNKVVDHVTGSSSTPEDVFSEARQLVIWHYQWIVLHDFLERLTVPGISERILHDGRKFYRFKRLPYMPVEFSAAAYRLGHSMVRQTYNYNRIFDNADFGLLFDFTGLSGQIIGDLAPQPPTGPLPVARLPSNWIIDWRRFYELGAGMGGITTGFSRKLDPFLASELHTLPGGGGNLALRNLRRGVQLGLPSGQSVARAMEIRDPLGPDEIATGPDGAVAREHGLHEQTPLWYYILKEAQVRHQGRRLGPVGTTIVSEVLTGLIQGDPQSYLGQRGSGWRPTLPSETAGSFTMADLLRFVDEINPIGDG
jgi:Animal haem peroxidase